MGRYYDETAMGAVRIELGRRVKDWPSVRAGQMFGCPCFKADGKLFAFVATGGVVLSQLAETDRNQLAKQFGAGPFAPRPGRAATKWSHVPLTEPNALDALVPWIRKSYQVARAAAKSVDKSSTKRGSSKSGRE